MKEIFADLQSLAQSDGAIHEISAIIYRDWVLTVDSKDGRIIDDPESRWSTSKLNKNEVMLLIGLSVQSKKDNAYALQIDNGTKFADDADMLLREFHDRVLLECQETSALDTSAFSPSSKKFGSIAREAIYCKRCFGHTLTG